MDEVKGVCLAVLAALAVAFVFYASIDREVARKEYVQNVEQCKPIHGCLFGWNCNHYNKMIEEACDD